MGAREAWRARRRGKGGGKSMNIETDLKMRMLHSKGGFLFDFESCEWMMRMRMIFRKVGVNSLIFCF